MTWTLEFHIACEKQLQNLDRQVQKRILGFLYNRVLCSDNPRLLGKALTGSLKNFYTYRVGDYRIIVDIRDDQLTIITISIAHRRQVYKNLL